MSDLHIMELGQEIRFQGWSVWRVPGGWLFCGASTVTFVPFSLEFSEPTLN